MFEKRRIPTLILVLLLGGLAQASDSARVPSILGELLTFHPGWVTRTVSSHDPEGGNGDAGNFGIPPKDGFRRLFFAKGEGRILKIWMTGQLAQMRDPKFYGQMIIITDGRIAYSGSSIDFFQGRGRWKFPLVTDENWLQQSRQPGAMLSWVPFPYHQEATILFQGDPRYFQVTYREGPGSSQGPSEEQISQFMTEAWWNQAAAPDTGAKLGPHHAVSLITGPVTLSQLAIQIDPLRLHDLKIAVGKQTPVPLAFFFGLPSLGNERTASGWAEVKTAIHFVDPRLGLLTTRLPIPLAAGQSVTILNDSDQKVDFRSGMHISDETFPGVELLHAFTDQRSPGDRGTLDFFSTDSAVHFVSLIEKISDGHWGDRTYLEGDEMIRVDRMKAPLWLGTGTEDYFGSAWYFQFPVEYSLHGVVRGDGVPGDTTRKWDYGIYRHHLLDPIVARMGMRFGMEAGNVGEAAGIRYTTLALAYRFAGWRFLPAQTIPADRPNVRIISRFDAEKNQAELALMGWQGRRMTHLRFNCPKDAAAVYLVRTYDAGFAGQRADIWMNGNLVGALLEAYGNTLRRFSQDSLWISLKTDDCIKGVLTIDVDSSQSPVPFSEIRFDAYFATRSR